MVHDSQFDKFIMIKLSIKAMNEIEYKRLLVIKQHGMHNASEWRACSAVVHWSHHFSDCK